MATAFLFSSSSSSSDWTVAAMGSEAHFGGACCGATFSNKEAAWAFLEGHGFSPTGIEGTWARK